MTDFEPWFPGDPGPLPAPDGATPASTSVSHETKVILDRPVLIPEPSRYDFYLIEQYHAVLLERVRRYRTSVEGRDQLIRDLETAGYNRRKISQMLGIARTTVYRALSQDVSRGT